MLNWLYRSSSILMNKQTPTNKSQAFAIFGFVKKVRVFYETLIKVGSELVPEMGLEPILDIVLDPIVDPVLGIFKEPSLNV